VRIRALVYTTTVDPGTPHLDSAQDLDDAAAENAMQHALADLLLADTTLHAAIVSVEVPNDRLLQLLDPPSPTVLGIVTDAPNSTPGA
jgi:hypothetical protein